MPTSERAWPKVQYLQQPREDRFPDPKTNLLALPADKVMIGAELMWGRRTNKDGRTGDDTRFQLSARYDFDKKF